MAGRSPSASKHGSKTSPKNSPIMAATVPAKLDIDYESPPLIFLDTPVRSTGAILSGQLELTVLDAEIRITTFEMILLGVITTKKPVSKDCPNCRTVTTEIQKWTFLNDVARFKRGKHSFPFSSLLQGHLPTTTHCALGSIEYSLHAYARTSYGEAIDFTRPVIIQRALRPGVDRTYHRVYAALNIDVDLTFPTSIHPIGQFPVQLRLTGVVRRKEDSQLRHQMMRLNWRIEEHSTIISPACAKHEHRLSSGATAGNHAPKGILHEESTLIGSAELKTGWKDDFTSERGTTEMEFQAAINPALPSACDVRSATGFAVTHVLVVEIILAEMYAVKASKHASPTGVTTALKMLAKPVLTQRSGMGIAWDEEQPPVYGDVPESPPGYEWAEVGPDEAVVAGEALPERAHA